MPSQAWTLGRTSKTTGAIVSMVAFMQHHRGAVTLPPPKYNRPSFACFVRWHCGDIARALTATEAGNEAAVKALADAVPLNTLSRVLDEYGYTPASRVASILELQKRRKCKRDFVRAKRERAKVVKA